MPVPSVSMIALLRPARLAQPPLGEHRRVAVVVDGDRQAEALGEHVAHRHAVQRQVVGVERDAGRRIDEARDAEAHREDRRGRRLDRLLHRLDELVDERAGVVRARQTIGAVMHLELRVDRPGEQLRPSQVDADDAAGGHDRPPYLAHGGPPGASRVQALPHATAPSRARRRRRIDARRAARRAAEGAQAQAASPSAGWSNGWCSRWWRGSACRWSSSSSPRRSTRTRCRPPRRPSWPAAGSGSSSRRRPSSWAPTSARRGPRSPARAPRARAAATRSCSCAPAAATAPSSRSRATPSSTSPATGATRSTPPTRSAAPRSRCRRSSSTSASRSTTSSRSTSTTSPRSSTRWAGSTTPAAASSRASTAASSNGGFTLRLQPRDDAHRRQAGARPRPHAPQPCNPKENDLTRARRQQKVISAMKSRVFSPVRLHPPALHLLERARRR